MLRLAVALLTADPAPPLPEAPVSPEQIASVTANEALRRYRELTSSLPRCKRDSAAGDEIVVCAPGPKDRYRAWNGDPVPEPRSPRLARGEDPGGRARSALGASTDCAGRQAFGRCGLPSELQGR